MYLLDSSVWVSLFLDCDLLHERAVEVFSQINSKIYIPYCVVVEVATVLTYKHSKNQANNFLEYVENNNDIVLFENQIFSEIDFFKKIDSKISFTDASLIFLANKMNLRFITFDKQIIQILKRNKQKKSRSANLSA